MSTDLREKIKQLQTLRNLNKIFLETNNLKSVFEQVYKYFPQYLEQYHFQRINLMVYDEKLDGLISDPYIGIQRFGRKAQPQPIGYSISGVCFKENRPIYIPDCRQTDLIPAKYIESLNLKSTLALPLRSRKQVIGIIRFDSIKEYDAFKQNDIDFLRSVADQLSVVFQNAILFENQIQADLLHQTLYEITQAVLSTESLGGLFTFIHKSIQELLDCRNFYIAIIDPSGNQIIFPYAVDEKSDDYHTTPILLTNTKSLSVEVIRNRQPLLLNEAELQERYQSGKNIVYGTAPKCWMGVPLTLHDNTIGLMAVQSYSEPYAYSAREVSLFETLATQIAVAIDRFNTEKALKDSEQKYRLIVEQSNDAIVISQNDRFIYTNQAFADMLKYNLAELHNINYQKIHTEEAVSILLDRQTRRRKGEDVPNRYETFFRQKDGTVIPVEVNIAIIEYKGAPATFAVIRDITEQKKILHAMQESLDKSHSLEGFIPICASCKKIRDESKGEQDWVSPEKYINERLPEVQFSHGICPDCMKKLYPNFNPQKVNDKKKKTSGL